MGISFQGCHSQDTGLPDVLFSLFQDTPNRHRGLCMQEITCSGAATIALAVFRCRCRSSEVIVTGLKRDPHDQHHISLITYRYNIPKMIFSLCLRAFVADLFPSFNQAPPFFANVPAHPYIRISSGGCVQFPLESRPYRAWSPSGRSPFQPAAW